MLKYKDKEMAIPKVLRNNITKYLGIIPKLSRKDFKQLVAEQGGLENTIIYLKNRLNEIPAYKKTLKVKGYYEKKVQKKADEKKKNVSASKIQTQYSRNKLFRTTPTKVWESWFKYKLVNPSYKEYVEHLDIEVLRTKFELNVPYVSQLNRFIEYFQFYKVASFIESKLKELKSMKLCISYSLFTGIEDVEGDESVWKKTLKSKTILTKSDIFKYLEDVYVSFEEVAKKPYGRILGLNDVNIIFTKVKPLSGSSYIKLPDWIANKKAVINIKNENDNLCFLYSVMCGLYKICDDKNNDRTSKYTNYINERLLKYDDKDMPMMVNKIIHFEKRNQLRINVFGVENRSIFPIYTTANRGIDNYPEINLLYITKGENSHYTYIKNWNRLMCNIGDKNENFVCNLCCGFTTTSKQALDKHKN